MQNALSHQPAQGAMTSWPPGGGQCSWENSATTSCSAAAPAPGATIEVPLPSGSTHPEAVLPNPTVLPPILLLVLLAPNALDDVDDPAAAEACCTRICRWLTALSRTRASDTRLAAGEDDAAEVMAAD